jgi:hypothetical protein
VYDPGPLRVGDRRIWVNSRDDDRGRPQSYRAENWPAITQDMLREAKTGTLTSEQLGIVYGNWLPTREGALADAEAMASRLTTPEPGSSHDGKKEAPAPERADASRVERARLV